MSTELLVLTLATMLGFAHLFLVTMVETAVRGFQWNTGPRDESELPLKGKPARLDRAFQNFKETFPFFVAAALLVTVTTQNGNLSHIGAITYIVARVIYIPLYVFAVRGVRSMVWTISVIGILLMIAQMFI